MALAESGFTQTATEVLLNALADPALKLEDAVRLEISVLNFQKSTLSITEAKKSKVDKRSLGILDKGLERAADALDAISKVMSYHEYEPVIVTTALADFDKEGLPSVDGFRKFAKAQRTSIENQNSPISTLLPDYIKTFNETRLNLIDRALQLYKVREHELMQEFVRRHPTDRKAQLYCALNPEQYSNNAQTDA